ncbi:MAG: asparagine synthetase B [Saprospiraceae bacterium]|nr:asparagine synthetase B [Candidatus Parvibacillus calidus]
MSYIRSIFFLLFFALSTGVYASYILIPMNPDQKDHLKAYGITYWTLTQGGEIWWLLNYEGGSLILPNSVSIEKECKTRGISYRVISSGEFNQVLQEINDPEANMEAIKMEKAPRIAVYTPEVNERGEKINPWDDAVTLALTYAEIPFDKVYDREIIEGKLAKYDWLHLHHEDFTGQYGKFYANYRGTSWYQENQRRQEALAKSLGFNKVSKLKLAITDAIKDFVAGGGFMFAMCSATDSYDIAQSAANTDICSEMFDGDAQDPAAQSKLDFDRCFAFRNFTLVKDPMVYEFSSIDTDPRTRMIERENDYFTLFDFSAKYDPVPTMLTQNHTRTVKGFMGQTTAFMRKYVKPNVLVMGENKALGEAKYIHGEYGKGQWTFYGGHDPEDYEHRVGDPPTDLHLHPNSPGYRLILNNVLFPAAKKQKQKT